MVGKLDLPRVGVEEHSLVLVPRTQYQALPLVANCIGASDRPTCWLSVGLVDDEMSNRKACVPRNANIRFSLPYSRIAESREPLFSDTAQF